MHIPGKQNNFFSKIAKFKEYDKYHIKNTYYKNRTHLQTRILRKTINLALLEYSHHFVIIRPGVSGEKKFFCKVQRFKNISKFMGSGIGLRSRECALQYKDCD